MVKNEKIFCLRLRHFSQVRVTRSLVSCVCFVDRCLSFFFWPLCCLSFFDLWILINPFGWFDWSDFWCFNATFNNISAISWRPVLVMEEAGVPGENHRPQIRSGRFLIHTLYPDTTSVTSGKGTAYPSGDEFTLRWFVSLRCFVVCVVFRRPLVVFLSSFF